MGKQRLKEDFESLKPDVKLAFQLLRKVGKLAVEGIGSHGCMTCPIACGYAISARTFWVKLYDEHRDKLIEWCWSQSVYDGFIAFYDGLKFGTTKVKWEGFLRWYLTADNISAVS